ncbi:hypothetical protein BGP_6277 [Beggiatoa sp. PS]|nr:hypothetical protein BGP_6277 [Beggiatoa sp. PS]
MDLKKINFLISIFSKEIPYFGKAGLGVFFFLVPNMTVNAHYFGLIYAVSEKFLCDLVANFFQLGYNEHPF